MDSKTRHLLIAFLLPIISGCNLNAESEAVDLCFKVAPQVEAERLEVSNEAIGRVKGTRRLSNKSKKFGPAHYLIEIDYQVLTIDNPNPNTNDIWSIRTITCEVKDGEIIDGAILGSKTDQILRKVKG
jgi:hypothetical protein